LGGSQRFCAQCGQPLKPGSRFCGECGHAVAVATPPGPAATSSEQVITPSGYEATSTTPIPAQGDTVPPTPPSADPTWPSKASYRPATTTPEPTHPSPPPGDFPQPPGEFQSPPGEFPQPPGEFQSPPGEFPRPPGQYQRPYGEFPPPPGQFPPSPGQFPPSPGQFPPSPGQFPPSPGQAADLFGLRAQPAPNPPRPRRSRALILALLLPAVIAAAVIFFVLRSSHATRPSASATPTSADDQSSVRATTPAPSASPASSSARISEQQAAINLAGLLSQSVADRSAITAAVTDVNQCGPSLNQDPQTFQRAAASHQQLLSRLSSLAGSSALPAAMLQSLTSAWQASAAADKDLGQWAQDEVSKGCLQNDQADTNFKAAAGPDGQATTAKKAFVSQWNPIASQYGLATYQWNQL
jgi:hypothetical protein